MTGTHQGYKFLSRSARTNLPWPAGASLLPIDQAGGHLGTQLKTLIFEGMQPIRQARIDFFDGLLDRLGKTEIRIDVLIEYPRQKLPHPGGNGLQIVSDRLRVEIRL